MLIRRISAMATRGITFSGVKYLSILFSKLIEKMEIFSNIINRMTPCRDLLRLKRNIVMSPFYSVSRYS